MSEGEKRITKEFLKKLLRSDFKMYYSTPSLNDQLYLHYKGIYIHEMKGSLKNKNKNLFRFC